MCDADTAATSDEVAAAGPSLADVAACRGADTGVGAGDDEPLLGDAVAAPVPAGASTAVVDAGVVCDGAAVDADLVAAGADVAALAPVVADGGGPVVRDPLELVEAAAAAPAVAAAPAATAATAADVGATDRRTRAVGSVSVPFGRNSGRASVRRIALASGRCATAGHDTSPGEPSGVPANSDPVDASTEPAEAAAGEPVASAEAAAGPESSGVADGPLVVLGPAAGWAVVAVEAAAVAGTDAAVDAVVVGGGGTGALGGPEGAIGLGALGDGLGRVAPGVAGAAVLLASGERRIGVGTAAGGVGTAFAVCPGRGALVVPEVATVPEVAGPAGATERGAPVALDGPVGPGAALGRVAAVGDAAARRASAVAVARARRRSSRPDGAGGVLRGTAEPGGTGLEESVAAEGVRSPVTADDARPDPPWFPGRAGGSAVRAATCERITRESEFMVIFPLARTSSETRTGMIWGARRVVDPPGR